MRNWNRLAAAADAEQFGVVRGRRRRRRMTGCTARVVSTRGAGVGTADHQQIEPVRHSCEDNGLTGGLKSTAAF